MAIDRSKPKRNYHYDSGSRTLVIGGITTVMGSVFVVFVGYMLAHLCLFILHPECINEEHFKENTTATIAAATTGIGSATAKTTVASATISSSFDSTPKPELVLGATSATRDISLPETTRKSKKVDFLFPVTAKFPPNCTLEQLGVVSKQLPPEGCVKREKRPWVYGECSFANRTICGNANPHWFYDFIQQSKSVDEPFRGIIIGCNKGYEAVELLRIVSPPSENKIYDWRKWRDTFSSNADEDLHDDVDNSTDCSINGAATSNTRATETKKVHVYCIEAMPKTIVRLKTTKKKLGYGDELDITEMVVADQVVSHGVPVLMTDVIGATSIGPYHWKRKCRKKGANNCTNVFQGSIDQFVESKPDLRAISNDTETGLNTSPLIQYMSITAEGSDYDILKGTAKNLARIQYIDFGYHYHFHWGSKDLKDLIFRLKKKGFVCYFTGSNGEDMWRITDCWQEHYGIKFKATIGCANANIPEAEPLLERMEETFLRTLNKTS